MEAENGIWSSNSGNIRGLNNQGWTMVGGEGSVADTGRMQLADHVVL